MRAYKRKMPSGLSNNNIYDFIVEKINENSKNKRLEIYSKLLFVNIDSVADNCISILIKDNLINEKDKLVLRFKRSLLARKYSDTINAKLKAEFYSSFISYIHWMDFIFENKLTINTIFNFKIKDGILYHNLYEITDEVKDKFILLTKKRNESQPLKERKAFIGSMIESAIDSDYITKSNNFSFNIEYLKKIKSQYQDEIDSQQQIIVQDISGKSNKKISAKYYALYHWVLIEMGIEKKFEKDRNDRNKREEIETFAKNRYNLKDGQGFYKAFTDGTIDLTKKTTITDGFGKDYKEKLISISNNDSKIISHLKKYPN